MNGGNWSDDDVGGAVMFIDSESEEEGDLVVNELDLKSSDIYLVKDHAFHWKVDQTLKKEKQYQTDITLCWNNTNDDVRLPQGGRRKKPRLLQNLEKSFNLTFPLDMKWSAAMSLQRNFWKQYSDYCISFKVNTADEFFQKLQRLVIDPTLIVELKIDKLTDSIEMRLDDDGHAVVEVFKRDFCRLSNKKLRKGENIDGSFSVKLKGEENKYAEPYKGFNLAEKLWEQKADADCTIVVANGVEIECHQLILKLHSPVFRSMFESGMSETMTRRVNIEDMTEEAMVAVLKFLYTWDLELPMRNMSVASRLLQAGHRYEIKDLEQAMTQLFGAKRSPDDYKKWAVSTTVEEILELYVFAHNVGSGLKDVETTCVKMLKIRTTELENSEQFKDIFRTKQEIAAKLCLAFAKLSGK